MFITINKFWYSVCLIFKKINLIKNGNQYGKDKQYKERVRRKVYYG